jgi:hypothetical protein
MMERSGIVRLSALGTLFVRPRGRGTFLHMRDRNSVNRFLRVGALALVLVGLAAAGCGGDDSDPGSVASANPGNSARSAACPPEWEAGWQKLADRIAAPVYCPSWLPAPLTGELDGVWHSTESIKRDRSYLMGFIWFERGSGEVHVNLRGYPGQTEIPRCNDQPCFSDPQGTKGIAGTEVERYSVNRGADTWHLLYAWEHDGSLYTVSQHIVPHLGLTYGKVAANLDRIMRGLELVEPTGA